MIDFARVTSRAGNGGDHLGAAASCKSEFSTESFVTKFINDNAFIRAVVFQRTHDTRCDSTSRNQRSRRAALQAPLAGKLYVTRPGSLEKSAPNFSSTKTARA